MKSAYVQDLFEGARVDAPFSLRSKELRVSRNGDPYLSLEFADRTGSIPGVYFRPTRDALDVPTGSVVRVKGSVTSYRGLRRMRVDVFSPECSWEPGDLVGSSARCAKELRAEFTQLISSIADAGLRRFVRTVFKGPVTGERFLRSPSSSSGRYACIGGLLEHTVAVAGICDGLARAYPEVNRDLLIAAALLHDIGKCDEFTVDSSIGVSDEGRLVGHVALGLCMVREVAGRLGGEISTQSSLLIEHAILSHHAAPDEESPNAPSTLEALLLHHADAVDSDASGFLALVSGSARVGESWTHSENSFSRPLWVAPVAQPVASPADRAALERQTA